MNEHKVQTAFILEKRNGEFIRREIPRPTDIDVQPIHVMGHYVGEGFAKEVRLGLPKSVLGSK